MGREGAAGRGGRFEGDEELEVVCRKGVTMVAEEKGAVSVDTNGDDEDDDDDDDDDDVGVAVEGGEDGELSTTSSSSSSSICVNGRIDDVTLS